MELKEQNLKAMVKAGELSYEQGDTTERIPETFVMEPNALRTKILEEQGKMLMNIYRFSRTDPNSILLGAHLKENKKLKIHLEHLEAKTSVQIPSRKQRHGKKQFWKAENIAGNHRVIPGWKHLPVFPLLKNWQLPLCHQDWPGAVPRPGLGKGSRLKITWVCCSLIWFTRWPWESWTSTAQGAQHGNRHTGGGKLPGTARGAAPAGIHPWIPQTLMRLRRERLPGLLPAPELPPAKDTSPALILANWWENWNCWELPAMALARLEGKEFIRKRVERAMCLSSTLHTSTTENIPPGKLHGTTHNDNISRCAVSF